MLQGKRILGVIIARGGSKGVPRKNLRMLGRKPLLAWTIDAAGASQYLDRLILSSDDPEIMSMAHQRGCDVPFVRPAHLAGDHVPGVEPVLHAVRALSGYDYVVLLQPTTPYRTAADIDGCIARCIESEAEACVTVSQVAKSPYWMFHVGEDDGLDPVIRDRADVCIRQALPPVYALNGAVYVRKTGSLLASKTMVPAGAKAYVMPAERSIDIDTELDFALAESLQPFPRAA